MVDAYVFLIINDFEYQASANQQKITWISSIDLSTSLLIIIMN